MSKPSFIIRGKRIICYLYILGANILFNLNNNVIKYIIIINVQPCRNCQYLVTNYVLNFLAAVIIYWNLMYIVYHNILLKYKNKLEKPLVKVKFSFKDFEGGF